MDAGAEAGEGDLWRGIHSSETWHDHLFVDFPAVVAAVFGYFEEKRGHRFYVWSPQLSRVSYEALYQRFGFVFVHLKPRCGYPGAFGERTRNRMGDYVFGFELRTGFGLFPCFKNIFHDRRQPHERGGAFLTEGFRALIARQIAPGADV